MRSDAERHQQDQQHDAAGSQMAACDSPAVGRRVLNQRDHAPQDQQHRPPVSEPVPEGKAEAEVPQKKTSPITIRTSGPAIERRWR